MGVMDLRLTLAPADLNRFRSHPVLRGFKQGRPRNQSDRGEVLAGESAHPYRLIRSIYDLAGTAWSAEMIVSHGTLDQTPFCFIDFRLIDGPGASLCALLQALADAIPFSVSLIELADLVPGHHPASVKSKPPPLTPGMNAAEAFSQIAVSAYAHLLVNHDCLIRRDAAESIHQMRVALRRLRSAMTMFKEMLTDPASETLRTELRWLQQILGAARDWDVLLADTVAPLEQLLGNLAGYERLCALIAERRQQARARALAELARPRLAKLMLLLAFWTDRAGIDHPSAHRPVSDLARAILDKRHRKVRREMTRFSDLSVEGRHQCRIDIKKLRYAVDFFAGLYPVRRGQRLLPLLASLQDRLGTLNDVAIAHDKLEVLVMEDGSAELAWAAGQLIGWHSGRAGRLLGQIHDDWLAVERVPPFWRDPDS